MFMAFSAPPIFIKNVIAYTYFFYNEHIDIQVIKILKILKWIYRHSSGYMYWKTEKAKLRMMQVTSSSKEVEDSTRKRTGRKQQQETACNRQKEQWRLVQSKRQDQMNSRGKDLSKWSKKMRLSCEIRHCTHLSPSLMN